MHFLHRHDRDRHPPLLPLRSSRSNTNQQQCRKGPPDLFCRTFALDARRWLNLRWRPVSRLPTLPRNVSFPENNIDLTLPKFVSPQCRRAGWSNPRIMKELGNIVLALTLTLTSPTLTLILILHIYLKLNHGTPQSGLII